MVGGCGARTCLCTHKHRYKICLTYFCFLSFCLSLSSWQARKRRVLLINDEGPELSHQVHIYSEVCMEARQCLGWHSNIPQLSMYFHLSRWMFLNSLDFFFWGTTQFNPHLLVQSKYMANSLLERSIKKSPHWAALNFVSGISTRDVYDGLCTKIFPIVYQI